MSIPHPSREMKADHYRYWQTRPAHERRHRARESHRHQGFDHEARMKDLLVRQAQLNVVLDLDKNETQIAPPAEDDTGPAGEFARCGNSMYFALKYLSRDF